MPLGMATTEADKKSRKFLMSLFPPTGASTFQKLQKTGEPSISDHLLPLTPGITHRAPSDHADPHSGQRPPALPNSTATQRSKKQCNSIRLAKPTHKPIDNSKATDSKNTTVHHEMPPAVEKNTSHQRQDPMIRNGRSADDPQSTKTEKGSEGEQSASAPRRTTVCKSTTSKTRATRNSGAPVSPVKTSTRVRTTSQKTTTAHGSELVKETTSASERSTQAPVTLTDHERESEPTTGKTTRAQATPTEHSGETISAKESTTGTQVTPTEHHTISANENTTHVSAKSTDHLEEATSTTRKATEVSESPTVFWRETTPATKTKKVTGNSEKTPAVLVTKATEHKATEHKATSPSLHSNETETTPQGIVGSLTSRMILKPVTSEAHDPQGNTHSSPGGPHGAGARAESNAFPAWAIVIVVLMAVIILLIFLGLILLVRAEGVGDGRERARD